MEFDRFEVGLGTWGHSTSEQCVRAVEYAIEHGYRFIDSAQIYRNEADVAEGIRQASVPREEITLSTKLHWDDLAYDDVLERFEESLDRLGFEYVDQLYVHRPIGTYDPEETLAAFDHLYEEQLIREIGLSNFSVEEVREALEWADAPIVGNQVEMHPLYQQSEMRTFLESEGLSLIAYSPLAHGMVPWMDELREVATNYDASAAQVSIAWLTSKAPVVPIPMGQTPRQIRENFEAASLELDPEDIAKIDAISREEKMIPAPDE